MRAASELNELDTLYREAASATAAGSKSFYLATRFFPPNLARAAHSVYWFCRYTDDLVDECSSVQIGRRDLDEWTAALADSLRRETSEHPVLRLFGHTAREYGVPQEYAFELIEGMRMDLNATAYQTFDELRVFCYRVASVVGLMMSQVIGLEESVDREAARRHAVDLGIAMQLTNILRDVGEDLERGRIYLPSGEMEQFGYSADQLRRMVRNQAFRDLMNFQVGRAREYYARGNQGIGMLHRDGRFAVKIASDVYREILHRIAASDFDVFESRAVVSPARKYWLTVRNMSGPMMRRWASGIGL